MYTPAVHCPGVHLRVHHRTAAPPLHGGLSATTVGQRLSMTKCVPAFSGLTIYRIAGRRRASSSSIVASCIRKPLLNTPPHHSSWAPRPRNNINVPLPAGTCGGASARTAEAGLWQVNWAPLAPRWLLVALRNDIDVPLPAGPRRQERRPERPPRHIRRLTGRRPAVTHTGNRSL